VAQVIERQIGVSYHPGHVWRVLRAMSGRCSGPPPRKGTPRARDLAVVAQRGRGKKNARRATPGLALKTKAAFRATVHPAHLAPRGETPC